MTKKFSKNHLETAIVEMFKIAWYEDEYPGSLQELNQIDNWYLKWERTDKQEEQFEKYLRKYLKPFVISFRLDKEVQWFITMRGFKVKNLRKNLDNKK